MVTSICLNDNIVDDFREAFREYYGKDHHGKMKVELENMFKFRTNWFKKQIEKRKKEESVSNS